MDKVLKGLALHTNASECGAYNNLREIAQFLQIWKSYRNQASKISNARDASKAKNASIVRFKILMTPLISTMMSLLSKLMRLRSTQIQFAQQANF